MGNSGSKKNSPVRKDEVRSLVRNSESSELNQGSLEAQEPGDSPEVVLQERLRAKDIELDLIKSENLALRQEIERIHADSQKLLDLTLTNAESSRIYLEDKYSSDLSSSLMAHQTETKECLERICPSVSIDSSLNFQDWLKEYEIQAGHLRQRKVLVLGPPPEQRKEFANKESQYEDFSQKAKKIGCNRIEHLKIEDAAFHPIKKAKSLGSLTTSTEADKNMKRKREVLEENLRLNMLATENLNRLASCTLCSEIARKNLLNPVRIVLNYTEWNDNNQFTVIIDTNVMVDHMKTVELLMGTVINERLPVLMIPYIVTKEVDKISKDKSEKKKLAAYLARQAMKKIAELMRQNPRIVQQTLDQMKACTVWKSKKKDNDDLILECCIDVQKSGHNAILWSEDKNLRIKTLGHRILALCTKDICEILSIKSVNPLDKKMKENESIKNILEVMKNVPAELVDQMRQDPKNSIGILTRNVNQEIITHPSVENKSLVEPTPGPISDVGDVEDVEIALLFELSKESSWTEMEDGNYCVDDGDDDLYTGNGNILEH